MSLSRAQNRHIHALKKKRKWYHDRYRPHWPVLENPENFSGSRRHFWLIGIMLKSQRSIRLKPLVWRELLFILRTSTYKSSEVIGLRFCYGFSGAKSFGDPQETIEVPNSFKGANVTDIRTKWFGNFRRFELSRVNLSHGSQNWFELSGVSRKRGFEKSGVKL